MAVVIKTVVIKATLMLWCDLMFVEFSVIGNLSAGGHHENPPTFTNIKSVSMTFISHNAQPVVIIAEDSCIRFITIDYEDDLSFGSRVGEFLLFYIFYIAHMPNLKTKMHGPHSKLKHQKKT